MNSECVNLCDLSITLSSREKALQNILEESNKGLVTIAFANMHLLTCLIKDPSLIPILKSFSLLLNDGAGVNLATRLMGKKRIENLNGTDFIPFFLDELSKIGTFRCYIIGSKEIVLKAALKSMSQRWKRIDFVGGQSGYLDEDDPLPLDQIAKTKPDIILVAMGNPKQETWIFRHREFLSKVEVTYALAGGAILDFLSNALPRAPKWMRVLQIEWFYRWIHEPKRLFPRYVFEPFLFFSRIIKDAIFQKREK